MRKINILNLYGSALGHNGDDKNILAFEKQLEAIGLDWDEREMSVEDKLDFSDADIIFMTHGKPGNIAAISEHFSAYRKEVADAVEAGKIFVVTGASCLLWGRSFTTLDGRVHAGICAFDEDSTEFDGLYVSDAVLKPSFSDEHMFGCYYKYVETVENAPNRIPLFTVLSAGEGKGAVGETEGHQYKGLYTTWALGPVMLRNPVMMREILRKVAGEDYREPNLSLEERAVKKTLAELEK